MEKQRHCNAWCDRSQCVDLPGFRAELFLLRLIHIFGTSGKGGKGEKEKRYKAMHEKRSKENGTFFEVNFLNQL